MTLRFRHPTTFGKREGGLGFHPPMPNWIMQIPTPPKATRGKPARRREGRVYLTHLEKWVLAALWAYAAAEDVLAERDGEATCSNADLAARVGGADDAVVVRALAALEGAGLITRVARFGPKGGQTSCKTQLHWRPDVGLSQEDINLMLGADLQSGDGADLQSEGGADPQSYGATISDRRGCRLDVVGGADFRSEGVPTPGRDGTDQGTNQPTNQKNNPREEVARACAGVRGRSNGRAKEGTTSSNGVGSFSSLVTDEHIAAIRDIGDRRWVRLLEADDTWVEALGECIADYKLTPADVAHVLRSWDKDRLSSRPAARDIWFRKSRDWLESTLGANGRGGLDGHWAEVIRNRKQEPKPDLSDQEALHSKGVAMDDLWGDWDDEDDGKLSRQWLGSDL